MAVKATEIEDSAWFDDLVRAHRPALLRSCQRMSSGANAEDLCQETLLRAYRARHALQDPDRFLPWARRIARNVAIDISRRHVVPTAPLSEAEHVGEPDSFADRIGDASALGQALGALTPQTQRLVLLRSDGVSSSDVASQEGMTIQAVDTAFHRARKRLRSALAAEGVVGSLPLGWWRWARRAWKRVPSVGRVAVVSAGVLGLLLLGVVPWSMPRSAQGRPAAPASAAPLLTHAESSGGASPVGRATSASSMSAGHRGTSPGAPSRAYVPNHCLLIARCDAGSDVEAYPVLVPLPDGFLLGIDPSVDLSRIPLTPADLQSQLLGRSDALACDARLVAAGTACDGRDAVGVAIAAADNVRQSTLGDPCMTLQERGSVPLVCSPIPDPRDP